MFVLFLMLDKQENMWTRLRDLHPGATRTS